VEEEERGEWDKNHKTLFEREGSVGWEKTIEEDTGKRDENHGRENQQSEPDVEVECLHGHEHMPKTGTEHVLKHVGERGVHDVEDHEVGKVDEQQEKTQTDVGPK